LTSDPESNVILVFRPDRTPLCEKCRLAMQQTLLGRVHISQTGWQRAGLRSRRTQLDCYLSQYHHTKADRRAIFKASDLSSCHH